MGVLGPMARSVPDLALLLGVQAGYDPRAPLSLDGDLALDRLDLARDFTGARIAWCGDMDGELPFEPGVLETCRAALRSFEDMGCAVETANPDFALDAVWRAWLVLRAWQAGSGLKEIYDNPALRPHMKPEAVFEVESGARLSAYEVSAASTVRSQWSEAVRRFFERYDFWILPTAQVFPFDAVARLAARDRRPPDGDLPRVDEGGAARDDVAAAPSLAAPAGFGPQGLPIGIQIVGPQSRRARLPRARPRLRPAHRAGSRSIRPRSWDRLSGPCTESRASSPCSSASSSRCRSRCAGCSRPRRWPPSRTSRSSARPR